MKQITTEVDPLFFPLDTLGIQEPVPSTFSLMVGSNPHPLAVLAAGKLESYLSELITPDHNFGLNEGVSGKVIGKMFGVLVVKDQLSNYGYLQAFSGKMGGRNHHKGFVPPVFDSLAEDSFLNGGMRELGRINAELKILAPTGNESLIRQLKQQRRQHSTNLQQQLFDHYHFRNKKGEQRSLREIFSAAGYKNPPSGAGECAGPKLLQYAFQQVSNPSPLLSSGGGSPQNQNNGNTGIFIPAARRNVRRSWHICWRA
ncbi:MAG: hypothetical protein ABWZ25_17950 [Chitinophagaceae bacterium]